MIATEADEAKSDVRQQDRRKTYFKGCLWKEECLNIMLLDVCRLKLCKWTYQYLSWWSNVPVLVCVNLLSWVCSLYPWKYESCVLNLWDIQRVTAFLSWCWTYMQTCYLVVAVIISLGYCMCKLENRLGGVFGLL